MQNRDRDFDSPLEAVILDGTEQILTTVAAHNGRPAAGLEGIMDVLQHEIEADMAAEATKAGGS